MITGIYRQEPFTDFLLFGTNYSILPEELWNPVYGITRPAQTWNPIRINSTSRPIDFDAWRADN
jgi:hypothetical protein